MDSKDNPVTYEEVRKQRLEENKKRMQELGLTNLSKSLSSSFTTSKSPLRQVKPRAPKETVLIEIRRSSRVANNPQPDYREVEVNVSLGRRSYARSTSLLSRKYASDEARMEAALKAESLQKTLPPDNASFVKPMLQSHVTGGFWLGLPMTFCKTYLPRADGMMVLEDENGEEWEAVYLAHRTGLSGGWRGFAMDHGLVDGDAIVFELIEHRRFKVHIVRASETKEEELTVQETNEMTKDNVKKTTKRKQQSVKDADVETGSDEKDKAGISKRKQVLRESESESESEWEKAEAGHRKGTKQKFSVVKDKENKSGRNRGKANGGSSRMRGKVEMDGLHEDDGKYEKNDGTDVHQEAKQLSSFFSSRKLNSWSRGRASKKRLLTSGEVVEAY